jgi:hypothetical protein
MMTTTSIQEATVTNDTTISLAMAKATRVAGDKEGDGGKSDDDDTPTSLATATATRSGGQRRVR